MYKFIRISLINDKSINLVEEVVSDRMFIKDVSPEYDFTNNHGRLKELQFEDLEKILDAEEFVELDSIKSIEELQFEFSEHTLQGLHYIFRRKCSEDGRKILSGLNKVDGYSYNHWSIWSGV